MKKIVSIFCALAVIIGTFSIPAITASAVETAGTATELTPSGYWQSGSLVSEATETEPAVYGKGNTEFQVGGMVFDYEIRAGYTYYLEFDYCGTNDFYELYPYVTVTHASNAFRETKPDNSSVKLNLPAGATDDWKKVSQIISGDVLLSCNLEPSGKYLEIGWHFTGGHVMFKNMKITEYDFSTAETQIPTTTKAGEMSIEDGVTVYSKVADWDPGIGGMVFNYKIESGKKYFLSFDYNAPVDEKFYGWAPQASTVKSVGVYEEHNGAANAVKLLLPEAATNGWVTLAQILDGDALLSGGAAGYLEIDWGWLNTTVQFKNIKVTNLSADLLYPTATVKFDAPYIEDGSVCYKTVGTTNDYYANGGDNSLVFDYKIEKEYNYLLSYDYRYTYDDACGNTPISAYVSKSSSKPFTGGVKDKAFKLNTSTNGWWNNWASDSTVLSGQALLNLNAGEYLTIISTYTKPYTLKNIRISKYDYCDVNFDSEVNATDLGLLRKELLGIDTAAEITDINGDKQTDILDLVSLKKAMSN